MYINFDETGRCLPGELSAAAYATSRRYFLAHQPSVDTTEILGRTSRTLGDPGISADEFESRIATLKEQVAADSALEGLLGGVHVPFVLPQDAISDIGDALESRYLPALGNAFDEVLPEYTFSAQVSTPLEDNVSVLPGSRHETLIAKLAEGPVVGIYAPCFTEYSLPAALERLSNLPESCLLSGGIDLVAAFIAAPNLLVRPEGYPPTLWLSALEGDKPGIGYHLEAYGANLNLYRRAHLNQAAEYWWHGVTLLG